MTLPSQRWLKVVYLATAIVFASVAVYLYAFRFFAWVESDAAVTVVLAAKILHAKSPVVDSWYYANGDVWVVGPQLLALVPVAVLGLGPASLLITVVAGFVVELVVLVKLYARMCGERWVAIFAAMVTLMAWSQDHVAFVYIQLAYGFLTVLYVLLFGTFGGLATSTPARPWPWVGAGLIVSLVVVQNPTRGLVFVLAPLMGGCLWPWRGLGRRKRLVLVGTATVGWILAYLVYAGFLRHSVHFSIPRGHIDFVMTGAAGIAANVAKLGRGLVALCGGGATPSLRVIPGVLVLVGAVVLVAREVFASRAVTPLRFVGVVVAAQLAAVLVPLLVGNLLVSTTSVRYLIPSLLTLFGLAAMLAVRALGEPEGWVRRIASGWLVLVPVAAFIAAPDARPPVAERYVWPDLPELHRVADELVRRGLTHGFSNVLSANVLTMDSGGATTACPVYFRDLVIPQRWLTDTACYAAAAIPERFYVVTDAGDHDAVALRRTLPAPAEEWFHVGTSYEIAVFRTADVSLAWLDLPLLDGDLATFPMRLPATHLQLQHGEVVAEADRLVATGVQGTVVYGPYMKLPAGSYELVWNGSGLDSPGELTFSVSADGGHQILAQSRRPARELAAARGQVIRLSFTLDRNRDGVEFPVQSTGGARVTLDELVLTKY